MSEANAQTGNRRVEVDGMNFMVPADTPDPLPPEVQAHLEQEAAKQKEAWDRQDKQIARGLEGLNTPAERDGDGRMLNQGLLPGDEPLEFAREDTEAGTAQTETFGDPVAPEIRSMDDRLRRGLPPVPRNPLPEGYDEDVTDRQSGWRP